VAGRGVPCQIPSVIHGPNDPRPLAVVRWALGAATLTFLVAGLLTKSSSALVASGVFGTMWWAWDLISDNVFRPLADWMAGVLFGDVLAGDDSDPLTLDQTAELLEHRLKPGVAPHIVVQAAMRLEEIYRLDKHDPAKARAVIARARELVGDVPQLKRYDEEPGEATEAEQAEGG
jgi:hypothetical protein